MLATWQPLPSCLVVIWRHHVPLRTLRRDTWTYDLSSESQCHAFYTWEVKEGDSLPLSVSRRQKGKKRPGLDSVCAMLTCKGVYCVSWIDQFGFRGHGKGDNSSGRSRTSTLAASWLMVRRFVGLPWRCKNVCLCLLHSQCKLLFKFVKHINELLRDQNVYQ